MFKFTKKTRSLPFVKTILLVALLLIPIATAASAEQDTPPTDNGGAGGTPTGSQIPGDGTTTTGGSTPTATSATSGSQDTAMSALNQTCGAQLVTDSQEIKIFSVGVKCFETITLHLAETTIQSFSASLAHIVYIVLLLYVIFFGFKVATGMSAGGRLRGEGFVGIFKIAVVAFLVYGYSSTGFNVGLILGDTSIFSSLGLDSLQGQPGLVQLYAMVISSYHSLLTIVMPQNGFGNCGGTDAGGGGSLLNGISIGGYNVGSSFQKQGTDAIWNSMDCMFSKFIGWNAKSGYGTSSGFSDKGGIAMMFGFITSKILPANGFIVGGLLFSTLMTLLLGFFRLAFVYILSIISLILLFSIGPLMIPMMLFRVTERYFEQWWRLILGSILQPVILFAFFSFIGGLLATTIAQIEKLFQDMKPSFETSGVTRTGDAQNYDTAFVMQSASNAIDKMDKDALLNGVVVLVISYLLISFIKFVGGMAAELSGTGVAFELQSFAPKFAGGKGGE